MDRHSLANDDLRVDQTFSDRGAPSMPTINLWHLFSLCEERKLQTFLHRGLWCSALNSIISFSGDVEGTQPYGTFVSCWHGSEGDPTPIACANFGADGTGIAIRGSASYLQSLADNANRDWINGRFGQVRYLEPTQPVVDPGLEGRSTHHLESEMRVALTTCDILIQGEELRRRHVKAHCPIGLSDRHITQNIEDLTLIDDGAGADALVVPIDPRMLFQEVVFGAKVPVINRTSIEKLIRDAGILCPFRVLS